MARVSVSDAVRLQALKDEREMRQREAVASGNADRNSALYRHAKLNGWDLGADDELHCPARAEAAAVRKAQSNATIDAANAVGGNRIATFVADGHGVFDSVTNDPSDAQRRGYADLLAKSEADAAAAKRRKQTTLASRSPRKARTRCGRRASPP